MTVTGQPAARGVLSDDDIAHARQLAAGAAPFTDEQREELRALFAICALPHMAAAHPDSAAA